MGLNVTFALEAVGKIRSVYCEESGQMRAPTSHSLHSTPVVQHFTIECLFHQTTIDERSGAVV